MDKQTLISTYRDVLIRSVSDCRERDRYSGHVTLTVTRGDGEAVGQLLRGALLTAVPGFAVTGLKVSYAERTAVGGRSGQISHAYARIPGVVEDVRQLMANLGNVTLRLLSGERLVHTTALSQPGEITAGDVLQHPHIDLLAPGIHLARVTGAVDLAVELTIAKGVGFQQARALPGQDVYLLPMDVNFQPVQRVRFRSVDQRQDQERIEWTIETKGNVTPCEAWEHAVHHVLQEKGI